MSIRADRLSANLSFIFTEWPFLDRFAAAADAGFTCVEFLFPYAFDPELVGLRLEKNHLSVSVFNAPPGNWEAGERGLAALPDRRDEFLQSIRFALTYAEALHAKHIHVMAGIANARSIAAHAVYRDNLMLAADLARDRQIQILVEPINPQDMPGYFLQDFDSAERVVNTAAPGVLGLQFDVYHCHKIHGSVIDRLIALLPMTAHMQIAGVPTRSEPAEPELPLSELFAVLESKRYPGRVGCEYRPAEGTLEGLGWITRLEESLK